MVIWNLYRYSVFKNSGKVTSWWYWPIKALCLLQFLWTGLTIEIFHRFGTSANSIDQLKINENGKIIDWIECLIKWFYLLDG